ncbi:protein DETOXIFICATION 21-like [Castanea sativa]|uniref:protein DETOXIFICATION 21-like n=1 Tax=Castanea sativa TaxID=21020 RepID=UPI003F64F70E
MSVIVPQEPALEAEHGSLSYLKCGKLWYYTALVLITGYLKNSEVSINALTICLNINGWEMMISLGFMSAASVRVGNELGRGSSKLQRRLAYIFTENEEVVEAIADLSPLLAVSILLNSVQPVLSGVAVGAGWQSIVAYVNVVSYYIIWVPNGLVLGYVFDMGVKGVWMGMLFGTFVQTIALVIVTYKTNWDEQVIVASNRVKKWAVDDAQEPKLTTSDVS